jgi:tryptophan-rich sensory protein
MSAAARSLVSLVSFLAVTFAAAAIGAQFMPGPWYESLAKPSFNPPNWIFAPVWSALYVMMAIAVWLVWCRVKAFGLPIALWLLQLGLNAIWSWLFFGLERPDLAAMEIVVLLAAILVTIVTFFRVSRPAGYLLVPYAAWVSFAAILNFTLWRLNA